MQYFTAGGAVRDRLLGRPLHDIDLVFSGSEDEFVQRNPSARKIGGDPYPIYMLDGLEYTPLAFGDPAKDVLRRDFTINALLLSENGVLHAHPATFSDLRRRILRPTSPTALRDDPARVFRAARFAAELPDFTLHQDTITAMRDVAASGALAALPAERVGNEARKACAAEKPGNFLRILAQGNCCEPWFSELRGAESIPAGPPGYHHGLSVLAHTAAVMDETAAFADELRHCDDACFQGALTPPCTERDNTIGTTAVWSALCHDLGKVSTPPEIMPRHLKHEQRGAEAARRLGARLRLPAALIRAGSITAEEHMKGGRYRELRPGTKVDLLMRLHARRLFTPFFLVVCRDAKRPSLFAEAGNDLARILAVTLPEEKRNSGKASGEFLRQMRIQALMS